MILAYRLPVVYNLCLSHSFVRLALHPLLKTTHRKDRIPFNNTTLQCYITIADCTMQTPLDKIDVILLPLNCITPEYGSPFIRIKAWENKRDNPKDNYKVLHRLDINYANRKKDHLVIGIKIKEVKTIKWRIWLHE